jgi:hypothetical protein
MTVKITGLTALNVRALEETMRPDLGLVKLTATTATFAQDAPQALATIEMTISYLPGNAHPKASLHAVARKLRAKVLNAPQPVPGEPASDLCPNTGVDHPGSLRIYDTCRDCGKQGKVTRSGVLRAHKPQEASLANLLKF